MKTSTVEAQIQEMIRRLKYKNQNSTIKEYNNSIFHEINNKMKNKQVFQLNKKSTFWRKLNTNYKYSALVTLSMQLTKKHSCYNFANDLADVNGIGKQKNYAIVILRLAYIFKHAEVSVEEIFEFFQNNYKNMICQKFLVLPPHQLLVIQRKCKSDIQVLKQAMQNYANGQQNITNKLLGLYNLDRIQTQYSTKQKNYADYLSVLMLSILSKGQSLKIKISSYRERQIIKSNFGQQNQENSLICSAKQSESEAGSWKSILDMIWDQTENKVNLQINNQSQNNSIFSEICQGKINISNSLNQQIFEDELTKTSFNVFESLIQDFSLVQNNYF